MQRPRFGYLRLHLLLPRETPVNHKKVWRVYREAGLAVKRRRRRHLVRVGRPLREATARNEEWVLDFDADGFPSLLIFVKQFTFRSSASLFSPRSFATLLATMVSSVASANGPKTVLVVDDEPDMLRLVEAILTEQGYQVVLSRGAENALQTFKRMQKAPDLVVTDVVMPGKSGPMLVDELLAVDPKVRVLFMSGYDDRQVVQRYVVEKGFALIAKPFTLQGLGEAVHELIDGVSSVSSQPSA